MFLVGSERRRQNKLTTLVVLQPGYLPWCGYFDLMSQADVFVHYDDVQFDKHGWRNRNRIKGPKGPIWLTVPILHSGRSKQTILEVEIDTRQPWRRKHINSIAQLYSGALYLEESILQMKRIMERPWRSLIDLDIALIDWLAEEFEISTPRHRSSKLKMNGDKNERLIELCGLFGASRYLSGPAAKDYIELDRFNAAGIEVVWHDYSHPVYDQLHGDFVPYLSAIDLLLNVGARSREIFRKNKAL